MKPNMDRFHVNRDRPLPVRDEDEPTLNRDEMIDELADLTPQQWHYLLAILNNKQVKPGNE